MERIPNNCVVRLLPSNFLEFPWELNSWTRSGQSDSPACSWDTW